MQVDDFKFAGVLLVALGAVELAIGISGFSAVALEGDFRPLLFLWLGVLSTTAGVVAFRRRPGSKYLLGLAALFAAPAFPIGTIIAAVAFIAIGRDWRSRQAPTERPGGPA